MRHLLALSTVFALLLGVGCKSTHITPSVEVLSLNVVEQTDEGARMVLTLAVDNPNDYALQVYDATYRVNVDGHEPFVFADFAVVPAMSPLERQMFQLTAAVPTLGEDITGRAWRVSGRFVYEVPGELNDIAYDSGVPRPAITCAQSGVFE